MARPSAVPESLTFADGIKTSGQGLRPVIRTVQEAIRLIDRELPKEIRSQSRWTFARALLVEAEHSKKKRDLVCAMRQLKQALGNDGWLAK